MYRLCMFFDGNIFFNVHKLYLYFKIINLLSVNGIIIIIIIFTTKIMKIYLDILYIFKKNVY